MEGQSDEVYKSLFSSNKNAINQPRGTGSHLIQDITKNPQKYCAYCIVTIYDVFCGCFCLLTSTMVNCFTLMKMGIN